MASERTLGERRVEERDGVLALIVRTTRRLAPWDVWLVIPVAKEDRLSSHDPSYGRFEPVRGMRRYYIEDITDWVKKVGTRHREAAAERLARRRLAQFLAWREKQRAIERDMIEADNV